MTQFDPSFLPPHATNQTLPRMNGGTCFIASPSRSIGSGGSTPTLLMTSGTALPPTQSPYFNIDMSKMSISRNTLVEQQRSMTEEEMRQNIAANIHIRSDSDDPKADLDALFDLSRTNRMKPMRLRKLPPSFFSYSPKTSVTEVKPLVNSSSSILTPQSPLAAHNVNHGQPPVDVKSPQIAQLQAPQRNSPAEHQQRTLKNKHFRTRSTPATLEETLAVVPPELPPSTMQHQHASPGSVPNATGIASPAGSNGPLSPLSSSSVSRQQHRHQPVLLPSRHSNGMLLHGHRPLTLAPQQPNTNDEAMCVDAAEPLNTGKSSPPNKKLAHNSARPVNGLSLHERQQSLPTHQQLPTAASSGSNFMFNQATSVPASPMLLLPPQSSQFGIAHGTHQPQPPLHFHSPSLQLSTSTAAATSFVDNEPLPPGWEMGFTESGQKYFINHLQKTTAWEDPRLPIPAAAAAAPTIQKSPPRSNSNGLLATNKSSNEVRHVRQMSSPLLSAVNATPIALSLASEIELPLPHGWEKRVNEHGQVYFADNINKRTSWEDPRSIVAPEEMLPSFQQFAAAHSSNGSSSSNTSTTTTTPTPPAEAPHNLRPTNLELASSSTLVNGNRLTSGGRPPITSHTSTRSMDNSGVQQQVRMRGVLQAEREQMHIRRREMDQSNINANFPHQANLRATSLSNRPPRMVGGLNGGGGGMNTMASDPFLGSNALLNSNTPQQVAVAAGLANGGNAGDFHSRQASCDSGMSSAGGCSLPQTPEGLLAQTLDELNLNQQQQQQLHMQQYNKFNSHLRSARDNTNYHYHQHYHQSSLIGNCWPPAAPQPQAPQFFHPQQNPTVHHKSASIDVGCLTAANGGASQQQRPQISTLNGVQTPLQQPSMTFLSSEDANMLSMAEEPLSIPDDLSRIDFDDLASILNPPSPLRNSINGSHTFSLQPPNAVGFMSSSSLNILQPSSQQQQQQQQLLHHRHQRQQAFCE